MNATTKTPLPEFPVDEDTLAELQEAMDPDVWGGISRLQSYLNHHSREAIGQEASGWCYSDHDVIRALIAEVRRLRSQV